MAEVKDAPVNASAASPSRERKLTAARREQLTGFLFSLPGLVLLVCFLLVPFLLAIGLSFTNQRLASPIPLRWEGFENYTDTLSR